MSAAASVKAGDVLAGGKYRVERVLGAGGMGVVVLARHVQLGQRVALKLMLKEALSDPANAERFAREARAAVRLQSAHTARVLDVGKLTNGEPYMVMEFLDGQDLDEVLRRGGPMPPHVAVDYLLQACEAFAEAHSLGMVHRDIKPKNLFLTKTVDGRPLVKVLDFGLAKTVGSLGDVSLTATSAVFGSPQYMSPEQMRSAKDVDARSDIWSIGVCLYELLTARVPFDAAGVAEICAMVLKDPVTPPSRWVRGLPPALDAVVVKCLAKDPAERFQTVAELAEALAPWSADEGSARRILHVMQAVQKTDIPTLINPTPEEAFGLPQPVKTIDAWDSGERARRSARRLPPILALGASVVFGSIGLASIIAYATHQRSPRVESTSAMTASSSAVVLAAEPPPTPVPVPLPLVTPPARPAPAPVAAGAQTATLADSAAPSPEPPAADLDAPAEVAPVQVAPAPTTTAALATPAPAAKPTPAPKATAPTRPAPAARPAKSNPADRF